MIVDAPLHVFKNSKEMKRKLLYYHVPLVLLTPILFIKCSYDNIIDSNAGQKINFSIGLVENARTRVITDNSFTTMFESGDEIGIFIYKRNPEEANSISSNQLYVNNMKMIYDGNNWDLESPLYYIDDETLLDIYAYYPYQADASASALNYNAATGMSDMLSASMLGVNRTDRQPVLLMFSHLLSMVHLSVDKTDSLPDFNESFIVNFHGVISGVYNLETKQVSDPGTGITQMSFIDSYDTENRICRAWVPEQQIEPDIVFSFSQIVGNKKISHETEFKKPKSLTQGELFQFQITLGKIIEQDIIYNVYDPYPNDGDYTGMVIETYNGGKNGKVISLIDLPECKWSDTIVFWAGCEDKWAGISNLISIQKHDNWQNKFPAFNQCALYGEGWYLPAIDEAYPFLFYRVNEINQNLLNIPGGQEIDLNRSYYMSNEISQRTVYKIYPKNGDTSEMPKSEIGKIRAFYEF